jgi:hypothetical protein
LTFFVAAQLFRWEPESKIPRNAKLWAAATALPFLFLGVWEHYTGSLLMDARAAYRSIENTDKPDKPGDSDKIYRPTPQSTPAAKPQSAPNQSPN